MKNYEKYADEIREYEGKNFCGDFIEKYILKSNRCPDMNCPKCHMLQMMWLLDDYEEPETDWSKVAVDTPILVRDSKTGNWIKRYFAKFKDGKVHAWFYGRTSWTSENEPKDWTYTKLAEQEKSDE